MESLKEAFVEDEVRHRRVRGVINKRTAGVNLKKARRVLRQLSRALKCRKAYPSLASNAYAHALRLEEIRLVQSALNEYDEAQVRFFHAVLKRWSFPAEDLEAFDAAKFLERIRYHLRLCGVAEADGFLLLRVHGECEPHEDSIWPHVHGVATGGMVEVLRKLKDYYAKHDCAGGPKKPLVLRKVGDLNAQVSYIFQAFWPCRYRGPSANDPKRTVRQRTKQRMPEPAHTKWLIMMANHRPSEFIIVVGNKSLSLRLRSSYRTNHQKHKALHLTPGN